MKQIIALTMKKAFLILTLVIILFSCDNSDLKEVEKLKIEISELQNQNKQLKDSLADFKNIDIESRILIGIPDGKFEIGKENRIVFLLHKYYELPKFDIYKVEGEKEVKIGSNNLSTFEYNFTPKDVKDKLLKINVKIPHKGKTKTIEGEMRFPVE